MKRKRGFQKRGDCWGCVMFFENKKYECCLCEIKRRMLVRFLSFLKWMGVFFFGLMPLLSSGIESRVAEIYDNFLQERSWAQIRLFVTQMPKGGDIHHHYPGAIYAEEYLDTLDSRGEMLDIGPYLLRDSSQPFLNQPSVLKSHFYLYRKLLSEWSLFDQQLGYVSEASDLDFFSTFAYFMSISNRLGVNLSYLKKRAIDENVFYIESQISPPSFLEKKGFSRSIVESQDSQERILIFESFFEELTQNKEIEKDINSLVDLISVSLDGINDDLFQMRFQLGVHRMKPLDQVFSSMYSAFRTVELSPYVVGVNILAPENSDQALKNYTFHMEMFRFFRQKFPNVKISLHAGELTLGLVTPDNLSFHITEAVCIAQADRIGHGVDIVYEKEAFSVLAMMKHQKIPVEICLTSNNFILNVKGESHPFKLYAEFGVPIVIASDDPGVSRNNLSDEFYQLIIQYQPSYEELKSYVYNSLVYSFLSKNDKEKALKILDQSFKDFEKKIVDYVQAFS